MWGCQMEVQHDLAHAQTGETSPFLLLLFRPWNNGITKATEYSLVGQTLTHDSLVQKLYYSNENLGTRCIYTLPSHHSAC